MWGRPLSLDEEQRELEGAFDSFRITALPGSGERTAKMRFAALGPLAFHDVVHGSGVRVRKASSRSGYHVAVPLNGRLGSRYLGSDIMLTSGMALLYRAEGPASAWLGAGIRVVNVRFELSHVHRALESQLGERVERQIPFGPVFRQAAHRDAGWIRMLLMLNELLSDESSVMANPMVALPYIDSLTQGLLLTADHPYRQMLGRQGGRVRRSAVRVAADLIETEPCRPLTVTELAAEAKVSVRALQEGFQRELGTTPMAYLRDMRLRRAHADLRAADPAVTTVASIARRWGFPHHGRFASRYAAVFGELPNVTLWAH